MPKIRKREFERPIIVVSECSLRKKVGSIANTPEELLDLIEEAMKLSPMRKVILTEA